MIVLSHRGYWKEAGEKNAEAAFRRSFALGFGTETDVRDCAGRLVISHDPPAGGELGFGDMLDLLDGRDLPLALNIKADGLAARVRGELAARNLLKAFVFDMSVPDTLQQLQHGNRVYVRLSEYEPAIPTLWLGRAAGVWLDGFHSEWWTPELIERLTSQNMAVCVVSPDLHKRPPEAAWGAMKSHSFSRPDLVQICTDRPEDAAAWFGDTR